MRASSQGPVNDKKIIIVWMLGAEGEGQLDFGFGEALCRASESWSGPPALAIRAG